MGEIETRALFSFFSFHMRRVGRFSKHWKLLSWFYLFVWPEVVQSWRGISCCARRNAQRIIIVLCTFENDLHEEKKEGKIWRDSNIHLFLVSLFSFVEDFHGNCSDLLETRAEIRRNEMKPLSHIALKIVQRDRKVNE